MFLCLIAHIPFELDEYGKLFFILTEFVCIHCDRQTQFTKKKSKSSSKTLDFSLVKRYVVSWVRNLYLSRAEKPSNK